MRYWGVSLPEYYERADVWPLNPQGEIFVILTIEDTEGIKNLKDILKNVPGIGAVLIGEGDLSQELGYPRQYEHKVVLDAMAEIVNTCTGSERRRRPAPHVEAGYAERIVKEGYRFLMCAPVRSYGHLDKARQLTGRALQAAARKKSAQDPERCGTVVVLSGPAAVARFLLQIGNEVAARGRVEDADQHLCARNEVLRIGQPAIEIVRRPDHLSAPRSAAE